MAVNNIQLNALTTAVNKLEALKSQTFRQTGYENAKQQANDYAEMAALAGKAKSIVNDLILDMVFAAFDCMGAELPKNAEENLTSDDAIYDLLAYAEDIADEYRFGGAA